MSFQIFSFVWSVIIVYSSENHMTWAWFGYDIFFLLVEISDNSVQGLGF